MDDLVKRLRDVWRKPEFKPIEMNEAADRIEELERQLAECQRERDLVRARMDFEADQGAKRMVQIDELRAACKMALNATQKVIDMPRSAESIRLCTQANEKLLEVLK